MILSDEINRTPPKTQAASMASARTQGRVPGIAEPHRGASVHTAGRDGPDDAAAPVLLPDDWGRLPPQMARELKETQREAVPEEYRTMVELYFKAISREAQDARR